MTEASKARTRIVLMTPPVEDAASFAPLLEQVCRAGDVAAVILNVATDDEVVALSTIQIVASHVQPTGAALLLADLPSLVEPAGADGAHFTNLESLQATRTKLAAGRLSGVGNLPSRHEAMLAAESGVDYVMFGEPGASGTRPGFSALVERVAWWAEIFQIPCVAFAGALDEVPRLTEARADFIALGDAVWTHGEKAPEAVAKVSWLVNRPEFAL